MLGWLTIGGLILVMGILADDWYAKRHRRPLSHMKPDPKTLTGYTGIEELDITQAQKRIAGQDVANRRLGTDATDTTELDRITREHEDIQARNERRMFRATPRKIISRLGASTNRRKK